MRTSYIDNGVVSMLFSYQSDSIPEIIHWGKSLGKLSEDQQKLIAEANIAAVTPSAIDAPADSAIIKSSVLGWSGRQSIKAFWHKPNKLEHLNQNWFLASIKNKNRSIEIILANEDLSAKIFWFCELSDTSIVKVNLKIVNTGTDNLVLEEINQILPIPNTHNLIHDFGGRWSAERQLQSIKLNQGIWLRENTSGRPGHDSPYLTMLSKDELNHSYGEVYANHFAWSGSSRQFCERKINGQQIYGAGAVFDNGSYTLKINEEYTTPTLLACFSEQGLDNISENFYKEFRNINRDRIIENKNSKPLILNTWEAVYFDHNFEKLNDLAVIAASVGVERFVLDDGWFANRRDDNAGLGDWFVSKEVWPEGLGKIIDLVQNLGMDFGLWFEPEMVNHNSILYKQHPEWLLADNNKTPSWRKQYVLDFSIPECYEYIKQSIRKLLLEYPISYIKWDHNRDLISGDSTKQTEKLYQMLDELRAEFKSLQIESCASGGARIDYEILKRTDRVWASDTNDALERQKIQRYTSLILPPELMGSHLGGPKAHTTGRTHRLSFRMATALFGWSGIEWNLLSCSKEELTEIKNWADKYKQYRDFMAEANAVRADLDNITWLNGYINQDKSFGLYLLATLDSHKLTVPAKLKFVGLNATKEYSVKRVRLGNDPLWIAYEAPEWWNKEEIVLPGSALMNTGLPLPCLASEEAVIFEVKAL